MSAPKVIWEGGEYFVLHPRTCPDCEGLGEVEARSCGHSGCCPCDGYDVACSQCDGTGEVERDDCGCEECRSVIAKLDLEEAVAEIQGDAHAHG